MKRVTLRDVAEAAGLSVAAVSMSLSGKGKISPSVVARVRDLAVQMGYSRKVAPPPDPARRRRYVAILQREDFPYLWNFSQPFVAHLEEEVSRAGSYPIILHIHPAASMRSVFREIAGARVGAVLALHYADGELFTELEKAGVPVIVVNNSEYQDRFFSVLADEMQGSSEATRILADLGHRRIGYAEYHRPQYPTLVTDRFFGYRRALEECGLSYEDRYKISVDLPDFPTLVLMVRRILDDPEPPTAWAVHDDYFAAYLGEAFQRCGVRVPRDISLIATGGDVLDYTVPFIPKISTMRIDQKLMASMAMSLLESRMQGRSTVPQVLKTKLPYVDRGSCRFDMD